MVPEDLLCSICYVNEHKYKCPACGVKTCSIDCVKRHKRQTECTGLADQSKFIPKKTLAEDESHINRDYNFLLNVGRQIHVGKGDIKNSAKNIFKRAAGGGNQNRNKRPKFNSNEEQKPEDSRVECVKKAFSQDPLTVIKRNNTMIIQLPQGMHRATSNKTGYDKKAGSFIWTIEWVVIDNSGKERARFVSYRLKEHLLLRDAVPMNILNNTALDLKSNESNESNESPNEIDKDKLHFYLENVVNLNKSNTSILALDGGVLISEALRNKVVLEYPTIYITLNSDTWSEYTVSEEEAYNYAKHESLSDSSSSSDTSDSDTSDSDSDSDDSSDDELENDSDSDEAPQESSSKPQKVEFTEENENTISEAVKPEEPLGNHSLA